MSGMSVNCASDPTTMSKGRDARARKSSPVSVSPIVSMMRPSREVCAFPRTQPNTPGAKYAATAASVTTAGVHLAMKAASF